MKYVINFFSNRLSKELPKTIGEHNIGYNKKKLVNIDNNNNNNNEYVKTKSDIQNKNIVSSALNNDKTNKKE
jgi:hypothetical protein